MKRIVFLFFAAHILQVAVAQNPSKNEGAWQGKFEQLGQLLPTPNEYRTGSGSPGPLYWQQRADYTIDVELNDDNQTIQGVETITYSNNSGDKLDYLWLQLDQNINDKKNAATTSRATTFKDSTSAVDLAGMVATTEFTGGYNIKSVKDSKGMALPIFINQTMMRIDLPKPLAAGQQFVFSIEWSFLINNRILNATRNDARSGMEYFPDDKNYLYIIGQWFPRMCVYDNVVGWQNKQFLGQGEFTLDFGNYTVNLTVPADHIVAGTGMVQNLKDVLTPEQFNRFEQANTSYDHPVIICTEAEAIAREALHLKTKKVWKFYAENVRDFAFATSRKFIWDAQAVKIGDRTPLAMSYYPKEGNPLWEKESTKAVRNTLVTYSKYSLDFPYPQATSVNGASLGMEYPMICFNFGRTNKDKSFSDRTRWGMIGVIIHEVGHNFFPMIVSNDERQWTWLDEGINTFVQHRTQVENYPDKPLERGPANLIVPYMKSSPEFQRPLMVNSEQVARINFGREQYAKCATALNILRETIMGPELFDASFKEYARRWAFHHPEPADFFRTMEDASAVDLDWFWRGWFFTTDYEDQSLDKVSWYKLRTGATVENKQKNAADGDLSKKNLETAAPDFSNGPHYLTLTPTDRRLYREFNNSIDDAAVIKQLENKNIYEITVSNKGGLIMPLIIQWNFTDGTFEIERLPAEIWRMNETQVTKVFAKEKTVSSVLIDPKLETSDINTDNNAFPRKETPSKFDELKKKTN